MSRWERQSARRHAHMTPWRPCRIGFCLRCTWRRMTGRMERDRVAHLERTRRLAKGAPVVLHHPSGEQEVITLPPTQLARLLASDDPEPAPGLAKMVARRRPNPTPPEDRP